MKIFNVIAVFDVYCVAESEEMAREAVMQMIHREAEPASEQNALEVTKAREVRAAWENKNPFVAADVSDEDFETLKGKTTAQTFAMLHEKSEADKKAGAK